MISGLGRLIVWICKDIDEMKENDRRKDEPPRGTAAEFAGKQTKKTKTLTEGKKGMGEPGED